MPTRTLVDAGAHTSEVVDALVSRRSHVIERLIDALIPGYPRRCRVPELELGAGQAFDAVATSMREGRPLRREDLHFVRTTVRDAAIRGGSEAQILQAPAKAQRVLWDVLADIAGTSTARRDAMVRLAPVLMDSVEAASEVAHETYIEVHQALSSRVNVARIELIEELINGRGPRPGVRLNLARAAGLGDRSPAVVVVARSTTPADAATLPLIARSLARAASAELQPLAVVRNDEIVLVRATTAEQVEQLTDGLDAMRRRLECDDLRLTVAMSAVHEGLATVPVAYEEACLVLGHMRGEPGVLSLASMSPLDYLIMRAGDDTARRLVPPDVRTFVAEDLQEGGLLIDTLLVYTAHDLNVKRAAEELHVHPNTAHYRLDRISERTGCNLRAFRDLELLTIAIELADTNASPSSLRRNR